MAELDRSSGLASSSVRGVARCSRPGIAAPRQDGFNHGHRKRGAEFPVELAITAVRSGNTRLLRHTSVTSRNGSRPSDAKRCLPRRDESWANPSTTKATLTSVCKLVVPDFADWVCPGPAGRRGGGRDPSRRRRSQGPEKVGLHTSCGQRYPPRKDDKVG